MTHSSSDFPKVIVFDWPGSRSSPLYAWMGKVGATFVSVDGNDTEWMPPDDTDVVVTAQTYSAPHVSIIRKCVERDIPVLTLADGILEFRNTWRNPANPVGSFFTPVLGHKMACIGRAQAARIESWGNAGACEVVGLPSADTVKRFPPPRGKMTRVLVATANTPWFDEAQRAMVLRSLSDLRDELAMRPDLEVWWRISPEAAKSLGVTNHVDRFSEFPMERCIDEVDAVISTPSTLLLYPMLQGKPGLALDYTGLPQYFRFTRTLASRTIIAIALDELASFPEDLLLFQRQSLDDELEWDGSATDRLITLIREMAKCARSTRVNKGRLRFPGRMIPLAERDDALPFSKDYDSLFSRIHKDNSGESAHVECLRLRRALEIKATREIELYSEIKRLEESRVWLEGQRGSLSARRDELETSCAELAKGKSWLEDQYHELNLLTANQASRIVELEAVRQSLAKFKSTIPGKIFSALRFL